MATDDLTEPLQAALDEARQRRERAQEELTTANKLIDAIEFTLRLIGRKSSGGDPTLLPDPAVDLNEWRGLSRRKAILRVMEETGQPMAPKTIRSALLARGRTDAYNGVAATLSRLKADGKVESAGYGKWKLMTEEVDEGIPHLVRPSARE